MSTPPAQKNPQESLERFFSHDNKKSRDVKDDLRRMGREVKEQQELTEITKDQFSAIREVAETIHREMRTPQDAEDFYNDMVNITNHGKELISEEFTRAEKEELLKYVRQMILVQFYDMGLGINNNQITTENGTPRPAGWGNTDMTFFQKIGLQNDTDTTKQYNEAKQLHTQLSMVFQQIHLWGGKLTQAQKKRYEKSLWWKIYDFVDENPWKLVWGGVAVAALALSIWWISSLLSRKRKDDGSGWSWGGGGAGGWSWGGGSAPTKDGWWKWFMRGLLGVLWVWILYGGYKWYEKGVKEYDKRMKQLNDLATSVEAIKNKLTVPSVPWTPQSISSSQPGAPATAPLANEPQAIKDLVNQSIPTDPSLQASIQNWWIAQGLTDLDYIIKTTLENSSSTADNIRNVVTETQAKANREHVANLLTTSEAYKAGKNAWIIQITLPTWGNVVIDTTKPESYMNFLREMKSNGSLPKDQDWTMVQATMNNMKKAFETASKDGETVVNNDKKAVLDIFWRKYVYDACIDRLDMAYDSGNYQDNTNTNTKKSLKENEGNGKYLSDLRDALRTYLSTGDTKNIIDKFSYNGNNSNATGVKWNQDLSWLMKSEQYMKFYEIGNIIKL